MRHLEGRVAHQHIDATEFGGGTVDHRPTVVRVSQVTAHQNAFAACLLDQARHVGGIVVFVEVGDQDVGAFASKGDGHRTADTAVASGYHRALTCQPSRSAVAALATVGDGIHDRLDAWNLLLLFGKPH